MGIYKRNKYWKPTAPKSQNYNFSLNSYVRGFVGLSYIAKMAKTTFVGGNFCAFITRIWRNNYSLKKSFLSSILPP